MKKYRFEEFAINCTQKKVPSVEEYKTYIGLEHMDTGEIFITRWGSNVPIIGEKLIMRKGDILLGKRNAYLRRAAIAPHDGVFSAHGMVLQPIESVIDRDFFSLFIASDYFFDAAIQISVGSLSPTINWKDLKNLEFNLPTLEKQKELAEVLWSIKNTINSYKKLIDKGNELIKAKFTESFIDKGYPLMTFNEISTLFCDGDWIEAKDQSDSGYWLVQTGNVGNGVFKPKADKKHYISQETFLRLNCTEVKKDDILISRLPDPVGRACIVPQTEEKCITAVDCTIVRLKEYMTNEYFIVFTSMPDYYIQLPVTGSTRKRVSRKNLEKVLIPVPPLDEQKKFSGFVNEIRNINEILENEIITLQELYKKIIKSNLKNKED